MPAPKFHEPYPGCETGGRPRKYSNEDIERFANEFLIWIKNDSNFWVKDFCLEKGIDPRLMSEWAKENEKFSEAYSLAKGYQESRIFKGSMQKTFDSGMSKFALVNNHGWIDKTETKVSGDAVNPLAFILQSVDGSSKDLINAQE
jgi:hypothetical protein